MSRSHPQDPPIACSLSGGALADRQAEWDALARDVLLGCERAREGVWLSYREEPGTRARLEDLVRREMECCPFFDFSVESREAMLVLRVSAPEAAILDAVEERNRRLIAPVERRTSPSRA